MLCPLSFYTCPARFSKTQKLDLVPALCPSGLVPGRLSAPCESGYAEAPLLYCYTDLLTVFSLSPLCD
jgi:hypothetical protein